jgi:hypothetical protein
VIKNSPSDGSSLVSVQECSVPSPPQIEFMKQIKLLDRGWVQEFDRENKMEEMYAFSFKLRKGRQ